MNNLWTAVSTETRKEPHHPCSTQYFANDVTIWSDYNYCCAGTLCLWRLMKTTVSQVWRSDRRTFLCGLLANDSDCNSRWKDGAGDSGYGGIKGYKPRKNRWFLPDRKEETTTKRRREREHMTHIMLSFTTTKTLQTWVKNNLSQKV